MLFAILINNGTQMLSLESFFPVFVKNKYNKNFEQISTVQVAFCFSCFEISCIILSKFNSVSINKMGRKNAIIFGLCLMVICNFGIGTLYYMPEDKPLLFISLMMILRFLQGYCDSLINITSYSIIMQTFSKEKEIYLGYAEASTGIGITFGPIIGSIIFTFLGY